MHVCIHMYTCGCRRCFHTAYYYLDDPPENPPPTLMNWDSQTDDGQGHATVCIADFAKHTANLHADGDIGFSKEYDAIQSECTQEEYTSQISQLPENKSKNRYLNIIACMLNYITAFNQVLICLKQFYR